MPQNDPESQVSPELKQLQQPGQNSIRTGLRIVGPIILAIGLLCFAAALISFFSSFGSFERPRLFWLGFVGLPLMFVGGVMCQYGFLGAITRFIAGETMPVATDAAKYVAEETKGAVETVAEAAAKGVVEGIEAAKTKPGEGKD